MKTKEELTALKEEVETLNKKLGELSEEELSQVFGGIRYRGAIATSAFVTPIIGSAVAPTISMPDFQIRGPGERRKTQG